MVTLSHHKPNELELALKIAFKALDRLIEEKPKGGLIVNKGEDIEAKMSYKEARLCMERIRRYFGDFDSFGICGECSKWNPKFFTTGQYGDYGKCGNVTKHRYDSCIKHSKENGGWGLQCMR
jgi:hypothetical protein